MSVKVAKYYPGKPEPHSPGFKNIVIHTQKNVLGGDLSPYNLSDENGNLLENIWQFSKVYPKVHAQRIPLSARYHPNTIIWEWKEEVHYKNKKIQKEFWEWRRQGMKNYKAVRYPNGFQGRHECVFALWPKIENPKKFIKLDYIQARKKIYCGEYARLAPKTPHFKKLKKMLDDGKNLQIVEVDGPDPTLDFPPYDQISKENPGLDINETVIRTLVNDPQKPFGHGYCIAALLLDGADWMK